MSDTAETLLREHLKLCSDAYGNGLVPTKEAYWANGGDAYTLCNRWYFESDLRRRTLAFLSANSSGDRGAK